MLASDAGRRIKTLRAELGIPQRELCRRASVSRAVLSRLENQQISAVQTDTIERLLEALGHTAKLAPGNEEVSASSRSEERLRHRLRQEALRHGHLRLALDLCMGPPTAAKADIRRALDQVQTWKTRKSCSPQYIVRWTKALDGDPKTVARAITSFGDWENAMFQNTPWAFKWK